MRLSIFARVALVGLCAARKGVAVAVALLQGQNTTPSLYFQGRGERLDRAYACATSGGLVVVAETIQNLCIQTQRWRQATRVGVKAKPRCSSRPAAAHSWRPHSSAHARPTRRAAHPTRVAWTHLCAAAGPIAACACGVAAGGEARDAAEAQHLGARAEPASAAASTAHATRGEGPERMPQAVCVHVRVRARVRAVRDTALTDSGHRCCFHTAWRRRDRLCHSAPPGLASSVPALQHRLQIQSCWTRPTRPCCPGSSRGRRDPLYAETVLAGERAVRAPGPPLRGVSCARR